MGFIRGAGIVILSVLLFVSLLVAGFFAVLTSSLAYGNVEPQIHSVATEIIKEQIGEATIIDTLTPYLSEYCKNNSEITYKFQEYTFVFPCMVVANGTNATIDYAVSYLIGDFYYKDYSCEFWKCFEESDIPLFLVSEYAQDYWRIKLYTSILVSVVLAGGIILLFRRKANGLVMTGILLVVSSLIILQLEKIGAFVAKLILSPVSTAISEGVSQEVLSQVISIFFSTTGSIFLWMFVIALILIGAGIILRLFGVGFKISKTIEKVKQNKEIKETKQIKKTKKAQIPKKK